MLSKHLSLYSFIISSLSSLLIFFLNNIFSNTLIHKPFLILIHFGLELFSIPFLIHFTYYLETLKCLLSLPLLSFNIYPFVLSLLTLLLFPLNSETALFFLIKLDFIEKKGINLLSLSICLWIIL